MQVPKEILPINQPLLSEAECIEAAKAVRQLKPLWIPVGTNPDYPFFYRLGASNYLDIHLNVYQQTMARCNDLLKNTFSNIYSKLVDFLECQLQSPVRIVDELAVPGFHIFHGVTMPEGGNLHWDCFQHYFVRSHYSSNIDLNQAYSLTVPIELTEGSGLNLWNDRATKENLDVANLPAWKDKRRAKVDYFIPYVVGHVYMFNSMCLHQIAPNHREPTEKRRMTLQGHLIKHNDGHFLLYW